jgi:hypothetical protein
LDTKAFKTASIPGSMLMPRTSQTYADGKYSLTVPDLKNYLNDGYDFLGWSSGNASTSAEYKGGQTYDFTRSLTLHAITRKVAKTFKFKIQDTNAVSQSSVSDIKCYVYNGNPKNEDINCSITLPALTRKNDTYSVSGWAYASNATAAKELTSGSRPGDKIDYLVSPTSIGGSVTYYSVTRKTNPLTATFTVQKNAGATSSKSQATCALYNGKTNCSITAAVLTSTGREVVGWNTNSSAKTASLESGKIKEISADTTFYSITKYKVKINFVVTKTGAAKNGGNDTCYMYNTATSCNIVTPNIQMKNVGNYYPVGWNTNRAASYGSWSLGVTKTVSASDNGKTYYSIFSVSPIMLE